MATYAIGDVQGCFDAFERLLERIGFDPGPDRLWLAGDLVNRGPGSLEMLRWMRSAGEAAIAVLGNHDLHLLAIAEGLRRPKRLDTLDAVLHAPDRDALLDLLAGLPFAHRQDPFLMVHAGLLPGWSADEAVARAGEATRALRADRRAFLETVYGAPPPRRFSPAAPEPERLRGIVAALTRVRMLEADGAMDHDFAGAPDEAPPGRVPWFDHPGRRSGDVTVICGHWSALGLVLRDDLVALDTGCVWGRSLTAVRLEDRALFQVPATP